MGYSVSNCIDELIKILKDSINFDDEVEYYDIEVEYYDIANAINTAKKSDDRFNDRLVDLSAILVDHLDCFKVETFCDKIAELVYSHDDTFQVTIKKEIEIKKRGDE